MRIVDTDFAVAVLRGDEAAKPMAASLMRDTTFGTTVITAVELLVGAYGSERKKAAVMAFLGKLPVLPLDENSTETVAGVFAGCAGRGRSLDIKDAIIAGIALAGDHSVVTRNERHFGRVPGLRLERW